MPSSDNNGCVVKCSVLLMSNIAESGECVLKTCTCQIYTAFKQYIPVDEWTARHGEVMGDVFSTE